MPIHLALNGAASTASGVNELTLHAQFTLIASAIQTAYRERVGGAQIGQSDAIALTAAIGDFLHIADSLDSQFGADAALPHIDAADAANEALRCVAELEAWLPRVELDAQMPALQAVALGIGLWCMRHALRIDRAAPIVNALANRANCAASTQETAATFALMQGFLIHLTPQLASDLERSDPQRPWRLLNLNLAITAIRSGDAIMMRYAFDQLNTNLPEERRGFYDEAYAVACQPGFPEPVRALIAAEVAGAT